MIFNTHSHINDKYDQIKELLDECMQNDVTKVAVVGYDYSSSLSALKAAKEFDNIYAVCGLQPSGVESFDGNFKQQRFSK